MEVGAHIVVSGFVQGVGFRYFVFSRATRLGLNGFVKNLYTGDVEVKVEGERSLIEEFIREVTVGPRAAQVSDIKIDWNKPTQNFLHFEIR